MIRAESFGSGFSQELKGLVVRSYDHENSQYKDNILRYIQNKTNHLIDSKLLTSRSKSVHGVSDTYRTRGSKSANAIFQSLYEKHVVVMEEEHSSSNISDSIIEVIEID